MYRCIKFILFRNDNLHVSDCLSVHHQEFKTLHAATSVCQTDTAVSLLAGTHQQADSSICLTNACCSMCSLELLMMEGNTVRNMQIVIPKSNKFDKCCILLVLLQKYDSTIITVNPANTTMIYSNVNAKAYFGLIDHNQFVQRYKNMHTVTHALILILQSTIVLLPGFTLILIIHNICGMNRVKILTASIIRTYFH